MGRTLWLVGMMGSGKTTIAPLVADLLGCEWADTDDLVEHLAGRRIADLLSESEALFRDHESDVVAEIAGEPLVVSCGGGVILRSGTVDTMRASGVVVWLRAGLATLGERVGVGENRPLIGDDPAESLERIMDERAGLYGAAAHAIVDTDVSEAADVAAEVVRVWNASSGE